jgi:hypothetical protein
LQDHCGFLDNGYDGNIAPLSGVGLSGIYSRAGASMKKIAALIVALAALYVAYPYFALYRLGEALRMQDLDAVGDKVDWPRVRQGVKDDVNAAVLAKVKPDDANPLAGLGVALAGTLASPVVDATVTPAGLVAVANADRPTLATLVTQIYVSTPGGQASPRLIHSAFTGLSEFDATIMPRGATSDDGAIHLRLELEGGYWMLTRIRLPT